MTRLKNLLVNNEMTALAKEARFKPKTFAQFMLFILVFIIANAVQNVVVLIASIPKMGYIMQKASELIQTISSENIIKIVTTLTQIRYIHIIMLIGTVVTTIACIIYCTKIEKRPAASMGLSSKGGVKKYLLGYVIGLAMIAATCLINLAFGTVKITFNQNAGKMVPYILIFLVGYMIQGMSEEIACRGFLQMTMSIHKGQVFAIIISAIFFSVVHAFNPGILQQPIAFVNIFLYGIFMSLLMLRTNSIWMVSAVHSAWNFAQGHVFGIQVSGTPAGEETILMTQAIEGKSTFINGGVFGAEGGISTTIILVIALAVLLLTMEKPNENPVIKAEA